MLICFQRVIVPVCAVAVIALLAACYAPGIDGGLQGGGDGGETAFTLLLPRLEPERSAVVRATAVPGRAMLAYPPDAAILDGLDYTIYLTSASGTRTVTAHGTASVSASAPAGPLQIDVRASLDGYPYASGSMTVEIKRNGPNEFVQPLYKDENGFLTVGGTITADYPAGSLAGAVVQLKQGPLLVGRAVTTDAAGKWSVEGVGPGDGYYIQVSKAGYNLGTSALFSVTGPGGGADLRLTVMRIINMGISMMGNASGPGWVYTHSDKTYTLQDGASLTVMGISAGGRRLAVASGAQNVTLTLWSTTIDVSAVTDACALMLQSGSSLTLRLEGLNILKSGDNKAGIQTSGAEIRITGTGTLNVTGGSCGAGIGGGNGGSGGTIEISGGTITAQSGTQGAGIGGGNGGAGGTIKISGGTIDANSTQGASIGGGNIGAGAALTITGGTITASGDVRAFGCGGSGGFGDGSLAITPEGAFTTYTYWDDSATYPGGAGTSGTTTPYTFNSTHKWVKIVCQ